MTKHKISPRLVGKSYRADFRHPAHGGSICRGLGLDKSFAEATCYVLNIICNDSEICQAEIDAVPDAKLRELGCSKAAKKALEVFFGPHPKIDALFTKREGLTDADFEEIQALAEKWNAEEAGKPNCEEYDEESGAVIKSDPLPSISPEIVAQILERFSPTLVREQRDQIGKLEHQLQAMQSSVDEVEDLRDANKQMMRRLNLHVKEKIGPAETKWLRDLAKDRTASHTSSARIWIEHFIATLPGQDEFRLSDLRRQHIAAWLRAMNKKPRTLQNRRNFLTGFARWCANEYDLVNPFQNLPTIRGVSVQDKVVTIQKFDDFKQLLAALEPQPYWKTLVATCVLAGPREGELLRLRLGDIKSNWLEVHSSKTDQKFRAVPIEETLLLPLLQSHIKRRQNERDSALSPVPLKSDLLFPSLAAPGTIKRTKSKPENWSGPRAFLTAFERAMTVARNAECNSQNFKASPNWEHTPQIYRHTYGSILARTGRSALQISRLMGNSPGVAATHYIDQGSHLEPWPVQWPKRLVQELSR